MTTALHQHIESLAKNDPAIHVSETILINLLTNRLDDALRTFRGFYRPYPDAAPIVQIGLKSCSYDRASAKWKLSLPPAGTQPGVFSIESNAIFTAEFAVAKSDDKTVELFTVTLTVNQVSALGSVENGKVSVNDPTLSITTRLTEDPNYDVNRQACGLTDSQVKRLEGLVEGSVAPTAINNIFRGAPAVDLQSLFPMITFDGPPKFEQVSGGLLIIAQADHLYESARCPCGVQVPPITASPGPSVPPTPGTAGKLPINISIPPPAKQVTENKLNGEISLYLPEKTISKMTGAGGPYPAVTGYDDDNGFIGYSLDYSVAFLSSKLSLTDPRATLVLKVEFYITAHGVVTVDLACAGRATIGRCWATNRNNPYLSYFEIGISPVLQPDGKLVLKQQVLNVAVSLFDVDVVTVASALLGYLFAYGGIFGFLIDLCLAREIELKLPTKLQDGLREVMGKFNWTIFDISNFDLKILGARFRALPAISRTQDSTLLGIAFDK